MLNFNFLSQLSQVELPEEAKKLSTNPKNNGTSRFPAQGADLRLKVNGLLTPSKELIEGWNLEFAGKLDPLQGSGLDIVPSKNWVQYKQLIDMVKQMNPSFEAGYPLFVTPTPRKIGGKKTAKLSAFANVSYNEDGSPKNTVDKTASVSLEIVEYVLTHLFDLSCEPVNYFNELDYPGAPREDVENARLVAYSSAKEALIKSLAITHFKGGYVDLKIDLSAELAIRGGIYHIPKKVSSGENKGKWTTETRQNCTLFALTLFDSVAYMNEVDNANVTEEEVTVDEVTEELETIDPVVEFPVETTDPVVDTVEVQEDDVPSWMADALDQNQPEEQPQVDAPKFGNLFAKRK